MEDKLIKRNMNGSEAIAESIFQEMQRDENILLLGEDVGKCGGVFGSSRNCLKEFGSDRVRDTPISEMTFTGMGVGLALSGFRPIIEIMFADFLGVCLEQIYNAIAKIHYMSGGNVKMPVVIKTAAGKPRSLCAFIAPTYRQGKSIAWEYLKFYTKPLMYFGGGRNETELRIDLFNGSRIQIFGADHPDSIRGMGFDGVVMDEYAIMSPRVWTEIIRPAVADKLGWVMFIGTPVSYTHLTLPTIYSV